MYSVQASANPIIKLFNTFCHKTFFYKIKCTPGFKYILIYILVETQVYMRCSEQNKEGN